MMWKHKHVMGLLAKKELERMERWRQIHTCPNCNKGVLWFGYVYHEIGQNIKVFCRKCDFAVDLTEYDGW